MYLNDNTWELRHHKLEFIHNQGIICMKIQMALGLGFGFDDGGLYHKILITSNHQSRALDQSFVGEAIKSTNQHWICC